MQSTKMGALAAESPTKLTSNGGSLSRRLVVWGLAAATFGVAALTTADVALAQPSKPTQNNIGLKTIPLRINNNTGHPGKLFVYVNGLVPSRANRAFYLSNVNGDVTVVPQIDPPGESLALDLGRAETTTIQLPQMTAMRIYFSVGKPVVVTASATGAPPSSPPGWVKTDPNLLTIFDFAEVTWHDEGAGSKFESAFGINATQVDMFGIAMLITLKGKGENEEPITKRAGFNDSQARQKILADFSDAGAPWSRLVMGAGRQYPLRVVAPYLGIAPLGVFPQNQLQQYINQVWQKYRTETIVGTSEGRTYRGQVTGSPGQLVFNQVDGPGPEDPPFRFNKPDTETAYRNELQPIPNPPGPGPGARARAIAALLGAGFMRTNLLQFRNLNACRTGQFYTQDPVNVYAKIFHDYALRGLAYSFGYDDTCDQSSFIQVHDPSSLAITLQGF